MNYMLAEKFGWTDEQIGNTPEETIMAHMSIMRIQAKEGGGE